MIKEIGSYRFPGFYESIFCYSSEFFDDEQELLFELQDEGITGIEVVYEYEDFNKYEKDVCETFMEHYIKKIHEVLPNDITEHEDFVFDKDSEVEVFSPKYYNYSTDRCFCNIKTNRKTLKLIKEYTLRLTGVEEYIIENFTSRDGFISFVSNNIEDWKELDIEDYEENMFIALLDMLIDLSDCTGFYNLEESTCYEVDKYYYAIPIIYCKNKEVENEVKKIKPFVKTIITE